MFGLVGRAARTTVYHAGCFLTILVSENERTDMSHDYDAALKLNSKRKAAERERLRGHVRAMRAEGLSWVAIGQRLGCGENKARALASDRKWKEPRERRA